LRNSNLLIEYILGNKVTIQAEGLTDIGRVRSTNQDSLSMDKDRGLYIVADGMGGHAGGEIASKLAIEKITEYIDQNINAFEQRAQNNHPDPTLYGILAAAVNHASGRIYEHALEEPHLKGMGTTATAVKIIDNQVYCAHVGDSRLYLYRSGFLFQLTNDHSLVHEQLRAGFITEEEAESHHLKNVITRSVGYQEEEDVDTLSFPVEMNDLLILCSDGLYGKVSDIEISGICKSQGLASGPHLVELANNRGGEDNITVIMLKISGNKRP
tara:strand:+ start:67 stop:873 length:807 start_codon:yes stop_codon:yes gene_type:complete